MDRAISRCPLLATRLRVQRTDGEGEGSAPAHRLASDATDRLASDATEEGSAPAGQRDADSSAKSKSAATTAREAEAALQSLLVGLDEEEAAVARAVNTIILEQVQCAASLRRSIVCSHAAMRAARQPPPTCALGLGAAPPTAVSELGSFCFQVGRYNSQLRKLAKAVKTHKELFSSDPFAAQLRPRKVVAKDDAPKELSKVRRSSSVLCAALASSAACSAHVITESWANDARRFVPLRKLGWWHAGFQEPRSTAQCNQSAP